MIYQCNDCKSLFTEKDADSVILIDGTKEIYCPLCSSSETIEYMDENLNWL